MIIIITVARDLRFVMVKAANLYKSIYLSSLLSLLYLRRISEVSKLRERTKNCSKRL